MVIKVTVIKDKSICTFTSPVVTQKYSDFPLSLQKKKATVLE